MIKKSGTWKSWYQQGSFVKSLSLVLVTTLLLTGCGNGESSAEERKDVQSAGEVQSEGKQDSESMTVSDGFAEENSEDPIVPFVMEEEQKELVETLQEDLANGGASKPYGCDVDLIVSQDMFVDGKALAEYKSEARQKAREDKDELALRYVKYASAKTDVETTSFNTEEKLNQRAKEIVAELLTDSMTELQKVKAIHDYMVINYDYDYDDYVANTIPYYSYTPEGAFAFNYIVCAGYAKTFKLLCDHAGVACDYVTGKAGDGLHAWNQVQVDGEWYNIDVTWDDPGAVGKSLDDQMGNNYNYFLLCDEHMYADHTPYDAQRICTANCIGPNAASIEGSGTVLCPEIDWQAEKEKFYEVLWQGIENGNADVTYKVMGYYPTDIIEQAVQEALVLKGYGNYYYTCTTYGYNRVENTKEVGFVYNDNPYFNKRPMLYSQQEYEQFVDEYVAKGFEGIQIVYFWIPDVEAETISKKHMLEGTVVYLNKYGFDDYFEVEGCYRCEVTFEKVDCDVFNTIEGVAQGIAEAYNAGLAEYTFVYDTRGHEGPDHSLNDIWHEMAIRNIPYVSYDIQRMYVHEISKYTFKFK